MVTVGPRHFHDPVTNTGVGSHNDDPCTHAASLSHTGEESRRQEELPITSKQDSEEPQHAAAAN